MVNKEYIKKRKSELDAMTAKVLNVLSDYNPIVLNVSSKNNMQFSECYSFLSELINAEKSSILSVFKKFIEENNVSAFCLTDMQGSFITQNHRGENKYLLIRTKKQLLE